MRRITLVAGILLLLVVLLTGAVPVVAVDPPSAIQPSAQSTQQGNRVWAMAPLLMVQDEAKVDALIATGEGDGKITTEQAAKIKEFWSNHHTQFAGAAKLVPLLMVQDEAKVDALIATAEGDGKITTEQAAKIKEFWSNHHTQFAG